MVTLLDFGSQEQGMKLSPDNVLCCLTIRTVREKDIILRRSCWIPFPTTLIARYRWDGAIVIRERRNYCTGRLRRFQRGTFVLGSIDQ